MVKCWHCGSKTRTYSDAYIKFAKNEEWVEKKVMICAYCYNNLKKSKIEK